MDAPKPETVILVNQLDEVQGYKTRSELTPEDCWRMTAVWIRSAKDHNRVLLAKRSADKDRQASLWVAPVNGTVPKGEDYVDTIRREIHEELHVEDPELTLGPKQYFENPDGDGRVCQWFIWEIDESQEHQFKPEKTEIAELKWFDMPDLAKDIEKNPDKYAYYAMHFNDLFGHWAK